MRAIFLLSMFPAVAASCWAAEGVDVKITPAIQEYCHIVRFPQGWSITPYVRNHDVLNTVLPSSTPTGPTMSSACQACSEHGSWCAASTSP